MKSQIFKLGFLTLIAAFSLSIVSLNQKDSVKDRVVSFLNTLQEEFPVEKAYLHIDKSSYTLGETVWFSAYLTAGSTQVPSPLSKVLYVDFFGPNGKMIEQRKVNIEDGFGSGDFKLPDFGEEGIYSIKAYSAWMSNFGDEYFFHQEIEVFDGASNSFFPKVDFKIEGVKDGVVQYQIFLEASNGQGQFLGEENIEAKIIADKEELDFRNLQLNSRGEVSFNVSIPLKPYKSQVLELTFYENEDYSVNKILKIPYSFLLADIQFMPEGGYLVNGFKSNIAFKGVFPDGSPVELNGEVLESEEKITFTTLFGGMGKFELTPEPNKTYKVNVYDKTESAYQELELPKAIEEGLVVQVINKQELNYVTVFVQGNYQDEDLVLVSQTRGFINYMINGKLLNGIWGVRIPKEYLFSGINHVSILNSEGSPLLERLFFFHSPKNELPLMVSKKGELRERSEIELDIISSLGDSSSMGRFSVSIVDEKQEETNSVFKKTILSELLLNSDLKGDVFQPGYYFQGQDEQRHEALDLVMMTNGWRRFIWDDMVKDTYPEINQLIERGLSINGTISDLEKRKKGVSGGKVNALIGQGEMIMSGEYSENGEFSFLELDFIGEKEVTISAEDSKLKNYVEIQIEPEKNYLNEVHPRFPTSLRFPEELLSSFQERNLMNRMFGDEQIVDLESFEVKAQHLEAEEEKSRKTYGEGDVIIKPEDIGGSAAFSNIFEMIQGRVAGVRVSPSMMNPSITIRGIGSVTGGTQPLYLLDNMPVDANTLLSINPREVSSIDIFKDAASSAIFGSQGANGVIAVYTKRGPQGYMKEPGNLVVRVEGFSESKEFYHPKYDVITPENSIPDKRSTIYWNPNLTIDNSGKASIKYFNSDIAKKHLVIIEGIDSKGRIGRYEGILE